MSRNAVWCVASPSNEIIDDDCLLWDRTTMYTKLGTKFTKALRWLRVRMGKPQSFTESSTEY